jgi:hypothetical protein
MKTSIKLEPLTVKQLYDYIEWTASTAFYPKEVAQSYLTLGVVSEVGEVCGVLKKQLREDFPKEVLGTKLLSELGDVAWYLARLMVQENCSDALHIEVLIDELAEESEFPIMSVEDMALSFSMAASVFGCSFLIEKNFGADGFFTLFFFVQALCAMFGYSLAECLSYNMEKLERRKVNGSSRGFGSDR